VFVLVHRFDDAAHLFDGFPSTENYFRKTLAQGSMMIDVCEAEILKRQSAQTMQRIVGRNTTGFVFFENFANLIFGHGRFL
jgi:hypothetical protein